MMGNLISINRSDAVTVLYNRGFTDDKKQADETKSLVYNRNF